MGLGLGQHKVTVRYECWRPACEYYVDASTEVVARTIKAMHERFTCPTYNGEVVTTPNTRLENSHPGLTGKTITQQLWSMLDGATRRVKEWDAEDTEANRSELDKARGEARGIAQAIVILSVPYYESANDVVKEAVRRYKQSRDEVPFQDTPGVDGYNPAPVDHQAHLGQGRTVNEAKLPVKPAFTGGKKLEPKQIKGIKNGMAAGFPPDMLAKSYGVSVDRVHEIAAGKED